jgi:hypothetical protein
MWGRRGRHDRPRDRRRQRERIRRRSVIREERFDPESRGETWTAPKGGARADIPTHSRIPAATSGSVIADRTRIRPPQSGHRSASTSKTRCRRSAHAVRRGPRASSDAEAVEEERLPSIARAVSADDSIVSRIDGTARAPTVSPSVGCTRAGASSSSPLGLSVDLTGPSSR